MKKMIRFASFAALCAFALQLTGCANLKMSAPVASLDNTATLRAANLAPANVGSFVASKNMAALDKSASMRGANSVESPYDGSFTQYLRESLKVELAAAGLLDPNAATVVTGTMTDSDLDAAIGTGTGRLAARFVVTRNGAVRFDRELKTTSTWESSFMGAIAIPMAAQQYQGMYRKLITDLLNNAEFRKAMAKE
ncbi:MAG: hypothetical protein V4633_02570 [Pseudomonadota bacterium]